MLLYKHHWSNYAVGTSMDLNGCASGPRASECGDSGCLLVILIYHVPGWGNRWFPTDIGEAELLDCDRQPVGSRDRKASDDRDDGRANSDIVNGDKCMRVPMPELIDTPG